MVLNNPDSKNKVWVSAHRGNSRYCPDNTMSSFISALQYPVDQLELDLHMSRDKEIVMVHNHSVDNTLLKAIPIKETQKRRVLRLCLIYRAEKNLSQQEIVLLQCIREYFAQLPSTSAGSNDQEQN